MFLDTFGRRIEVGHVLANGQRKHTHGGITVGVVTGFTDCTILVKTLHVHEIYVEPEDQKGLPYYQKTHSREYNQPQGYYWRKSCYRAPENCFITGQTEEQLVEHITSTLKIALIEDPRIAADREWKAKWAARKAELAEQAKQEEQATVTMQRHALDEITRISEECGLYD
jgi:hypothetical protein